ncbi:MAG: outer membrane protein assembly factor BamB [Halioglobus sp.]|jgi:outer membrane protein assembly factor BamB
MSTNFKIKYINKIIGGVLASLIILLTMSCHDSNTPPNYDTFNGWNVISSSKFRLYPIIDNKLVIISGHCEGVACLKGIDLITGDEKWTYKNIDLESIFYNATLYIDENRICIPLKKKTLCIDKVSGLELWEYEHENVTLMEAHLSGAKDNIFRSGRNVNAHSLWQYSKGNGQQKLIKEFPTKLGANSIIRTPAIINQFNSILVTSVDYYHVDEMDSYGFIIRIDENNALDTLLKTHNIKKANFKPIPYHDEQVLLLINLSTLILYDLTKDAVLWQTDMPHSILTSRIEIVNDTIYYPCEDEYLYALDAKNGSILWKSEGSGTPSRIACNNNYIFMTTGNSGFLNQYDKSSGKLLNKYKFSDYFRAIQRTIAIKDNVIVFSDGRFWYARDVSKLGSDLLLKQVINLQ